ncbi:MAG: hypothetical protein ALAOOOJD_03499 [bacterium]|nr:hypothetical protein [bacterium]
MPILERWKISRLTRATEKCERGRPFSLSVKISNTPTLKRPIFPVNRPPARIGTMFPKPSMPMRRLKNNSMEGGPKNPGSPNSNVLALSRKNSRFSGKKSGKRVKLTCSTSASTCAKSVLAVKSSVRLDVSPYLTSTPASNFSSRSGLASSKRSRVALPNVNGLICKLKPCFNSRKSSKLPAREMRKKPPLSRDHEAQFTSSVLRLMVRVKLIPQLCSGNDLNFKFQNGILNSADQPCS